jgi:hypothetical protein
MKHQKGYAPLEEPNWNEDLVEALELKKERPPSHQKIKKKNEKMKEGNKKGREEQSIRRNK